MTTERTSPGLTSGSSDLRRLNVAMLFAALAAFGLLYSTQALLPAIGASFGVGPTSASLTVSAATGALALANLPLSSVAESVGRVPVMRAGLLVACVFTFVAAAAPHFWVWSWPAAWSGSRSRRWSRWPSLSTSATRCTPPSSARRSACTSPATRSAASPDD